MRNYDSHWSKPLLINDVRPLWVSPARIYASKPLADGMERVFKVVGRNLHPAPGKTTQVRLVGPTTLTFTAENDGDQATRVEHFVARVVLSDLPVGTYRVEVSREGLTWVPMGDAALTVDPDPPQKKAFFVSEFKTPTDPCLPDGNDDHPGIDDTGCIVRAINAAAAATPSVVVFGAGQWDVRFEGPDYYETKWGSNGIEVPKGVSLMGRSKELTKIVKALADPLPEDYQWRRCNEWAVPKPPGCAEDFTNGKGVLSALFTLHGEQSISGIHFHHKTRNGIELTLRLGHQFGLNFGLQEKDDLRVSNVKIFDNTFTGMVTVISSELDVIRLVVWGNDLQAYAVNIHTGPPGNPNNLQNFDPFPHLVLRDSIISGNTFLPGDYNNPNLQSGVLATAIGASEKLDFSDNVADGLVNGGWRAGFFWHTGFNQEKVLVSRNRLSCTGDKAGDGEAIVFDANYHDTAFYNLAPVKSASPTAVTINAELSEQLANYYKEFWVQVVKGKGVGQSRKIVSYQVNAGEVTLQVAPKWDIVPDPATSKIMIGEAVWQAIVVDNFADNRAVITERQGCSHNNPNGEEPGMIAFTSNTIDSSIWNNRMLGTGGVIASTSQHFDGYSMGCKLLFPIAGVCSCSCASVPSPSCPAPSCPGACECLSDLCYGIKRAFFSYFNDVRYNFIDRSVPEIDPRAPGVGKPHKFGGIQIGFSSHHTAESAVLIKNLTIAKNRLFKSWYDVLLSGNCDGNHEPIDHHQYGAVMADGYNNWASYPDLVRGLVITNNVIKYVPQGIDLGNKAISKAVVDGNVLTEISGECIFDDATDTVEQNNSCSP